MKLVVDIGSNTIKCLLGRAAGGGVDVLLEESRDCRISAGAGKLVANAADLISACIKGFELRARKEFDEDFEILAVGTSALRDAPNKSQVLRDVKNSTGVKVRILSGAEEGLLSRLGASSDPFVSALKKNCVFFDLGGGSIETVFEGSGAHKNVVISLPEGAVSLTKKYIKNIGSKITKLSRAQIAEHCARAFKKISASLKSESVGEFALLGTGGAASAARKIASLYSGTDSQRITMSQMEYALARVCECGAERRAAKFGITKSRSEIVPAAFVCIIALMRALGKNEFFHTYRNLRYGVILHDDVSEHTKIVAQNADKIKRRNAVSRSKAEKKKAVVSQKKKEASNGAKRAVSKGKARLPTPPQKQKSVNIKRGKKAHSKVSLRFKRTSEK